MRLCLSFIYLPFPYPVGGVVLGGGWRGCPAGCEVCWVPLWKVTADLSTGPVPCVTLPCWVGFWRPTLEVSYAEAFSISNQNREEFTTYINYALDVDVDAVPQKRLANILAQDRANWLLQRIDDLFYYWAMAWRKFYPYWYLFYPFYCRLRKQ